MLTVGQVVSQGRLSHREERVCQILIIVSCLTCQESLGVLIGLLTMLLGECGILTDSCFAFVITRLVGLLIAIIIAY